MNWKNAINESEITTSRFIDELIRDIISGNMDREQIIDAIKKEYEDQMNPYKIGLKAWEDSLKEFLERTDEDLHNEYNQKIINTLKSYNNVLEESKKVAESAGKILNDISTVEVSDDFKDLYDLMKERISNLTHKNDFIEEKRQNLINGKLEYDETYEWFVDNKKNHIEFMIGKFNDDIFELETIMDDKIRMVNKIFDELKLK